MSFLGMSPGDGYDEKGNKIVTDNKPDNRNFVITDKQTVKDLKKSEGTVDDVSSVKSAVELPSAKVRKAMGEAVEKSNNPTEDDRTGGFHEEGGYFGKTVNGEELVSHANAGKYVDPREEGHAEINVFEPENYSIQTINGTFHVHPGGIFYDAISNAIGGAKSPGMFNIGPSAEDINNAKTRSGPGGITGNSYVLAPRDNKVFIYNGNGTVATFPLNNFTTIGIK